MKSLRLTIFATVALATGGFATATMADPPPWAPAHGSHARHHYVYYPRAEAYYAPASRTWFWMGSDDWLAGVNLPRALRSFVRSGGINIELDVDRPYLRNRYVTRRYGGRHHAHRRHDGDHRRHRGDHDRDHDWRDRDRHDRDDRDDWDDD